MRADSDPEGACQTCGTTARDRRILEALRALLGATFGKDGPAPETRGLSVNSVAWQARAVLREAGTEMRVAEVADAVLRRFGEGTRKLPIRTSVSGALAQMAERGIWGVERVRRGIYRATPEEAPLLEGGHDAEGGEPGPAGLGDPAVPGTREPEPGDGGARDPGSD